jgi:N-acetylmuramoyl-L-alanine amidase
MVTIGGMDRTILTLAVAATLVVIGSPAPAMAPPPSAEGKARLEASAHPLVRPALLVSYAEIKCLTLNVYHEARGEPAEGQLAVAQVTLNRVGTDGFADSVCGVVRQGRNHNACQFGWACTPASQRDAAADVVAWRKAQNVAVQALAGGRDPTRGALYFQARGKLPAWASHATNRVVIGNHVFFRLDEEAPPKLLASRD